MKAAVLEGPRTLRIVESPLPRCGPRDVLVRVEGCGVCASNLPVWEGRPWFSYPLEAGAPGHEAWGTVEQTGKEVMTFRPGDRVTFISYHAYAQFDVAPETSIVPLPSSLAGKAFPGEPIACAINIFARCDIRRGMTLAVVGIGFLGALLVMMAVNAGARVIAISRRAASLNVALRLGAEAAVPITGPDAIAERVSELTGGEYCDRTIESAGLQETLDIAAMCTRIRGRMIIAGYHQDGKRRVDMQLWNWRGIDCVNAHERDAKRYTQGLQTAVAAVASGVIDPFPLFTHRVPLEDADKAFGLLESRPDTFMKALLING